MAGLIRYLMNKDIENVARWGIHFVALPDVDQCIKAAAVLLLHPVSQEAFDILKSVSEGAWFVIRAFYAGDTLN